MPSGEPEELHSAAYFGAYRDFWWNADHLELRARRLGFDDVRSVLDVGSGQGHWGRLLGHVLPGDAVVTGVDREPAWVEEATRRAEEEGLADRYSYREGVAEQLPFDDDSFDLVTCQTVLIHMPDPSAAVREMVRVAKPGGLVLASEPNNRSVMLVRSSLQTDSSIEELLDVARFYMVCERGQLALGLGDSSVGDLVPGFFADAGLESVEAFQSDKVALLLPPYEGEEQQAHRGQFLDEAENRVWGWTPDEARGYWVAGGGDESEFEAVWERRLAEAKAAAAAIHEGTFRWTGGDILYLVAGRKPV
jgi:SAM-dependent methyltransferase